MSTNGKPDYADVQTAIVALEQAIDKSLRELEREHENNVRLRAAIAKALARCTQCGGNGVVTNALYGQHDCRLCADLRAALEPS